jgi:hypothetical protein
VCPLARRPFVSEVTVERRTRKKYLLLIYHGDLPLPGSPEWEALSEDARVLDEQAFVEVT